MPDHFNAGAAARQTVQHLHLMSSGDEMDHRPAFAAYDPESRDFRGVGPTAMAAPKPDSPATYSRSRSSRSLMQFRLSLRSFRNRR